MAIQGPEFSTALAKVRPHLNVEIVKRSDRAEGFVVLPLQTLEFERTLAWLNRCEGSPRIGRTAIEKRLRSCTSLEFGSCFKAVIRPKVSGQLSKVPLIQEPDFRCFPKSALGRNLFARFRLASRRPPINAANCMRSPSATAGLWCRSSRTRSFPVQRVANTGRR